MLLGHLSVSRVLNPGLPPGKAFMGAPSYRCQSATKCMSLTQPTLASNLLSAHPPTPFHLEQSGSVPDTALHALPDASARARARIHAHAPLSCKPMAKVRAAATVPDLVANSLWGLQPKPGGNTRKRDRKGILRNGRRGFAVYSELCGPEPGGTRFRTKPIHL